MRILLLYRRMAFTVSLDYTSNRGVRRGRNLVKAKQHPPVTGCTPYQTTMSTFHTEVMIDDNWYSKVVQ